MDIRNMIIILKNKEVCKFNKNDKHILMARGYFELPNTRWGRFKKRIRRLFKK